MKKWILFIVIILGLNVYGTRYYLKTDGDDSASGLSWDQAFKTLSVAINAAYDIENETESEVWIAAGTYEKRNFSIPRYISVYGGFLGTESKLDQRRNSELTIVDFRYQPATINNSGLLDSVDCIRMGSQSGNYFIRNNDTGIMRNCKFYGNESSGRFRFIENRGLIQNCVIVTPFDVSVVSNYETGKIYNSILIRENRLNYTGDHSAVSNSGGIVENCCYSNADNQNGNINSDPLFLNCEGNVLSWDFHLRPESPCINSGNAEHAPSVDQNGISRPLDGEVDMGAYEADPHSFQPLFYAVDRMTYAGEPVSFFSCSYQNVNSWKWDFDSDGNIDSTEQNPVFTYLSPGYYSVSLTVSNGTVEETTVKNDWVYVGKRYYVQKNGSDSNTGEDWAQSFQTVSTAVNASEAWDSIWIAEGLYAEADEITVPYHVALFGGFEGVETAISQRNCDRFHSLIDGSEEHRCFTNHGILDHLTIQNGAASYGAGIYNYGLVKNCNVMNNIAQYSGGGILNALYGQVINSLIMNNTAKNGGGIRTYDGDVSHCVILDNNASEKGGGIYVDDCREITNSIVWNNSAEDDGDDIKASSIKLIAGCCYSEAAEDSSNISVDPDFVNPIEDYDLWDYHLQPGSPCLEAGVLSELAPLDRDGVLRPQGSGIDIGIYESSSELLSALFYSSLKGVYKGSAVCFYDYSYGNITTWEWDFDGDGQIDSTQQNPTHVYSEQGFYTVSLKVSDGVSESTLVKNDLIYVGSVFYVKSDGNDENDGMSWEKAVQSIDYAISLASPWDAVWVASGYYLRMTQIVVPEKIGLFGGFEGQELSFSQRNTICNRVIVDCQRKERCFLNHGTLDGFSITKGFSFNNLYDDQNQHGGGVYNTGILQNCILYDNSGRYGGGVYNSGTAENCVVYNNKSHDVMGVYNDEGTLKHLTVVTSDEDSKDPLIRNNKGTVINCIAWGSSNEDYAVDIRNIDGSVTSCCSGNYVYGTGNIRSNPQFINLNGPVSSWCFELKDNSYCIDAGADISDTDLTGSSRPEGQSSDIGAYENRSNQLRSFFYIDKDFVYPGEDVSFNNLSIGNVVSWAWDFDSDGTVDSTEQHPVYAYPDAGLYSVSLTVSDGERDSMYSLDYVIYVAPTIYVKTDGNDSLSGRSWENAFQSISRALDEIPEGGNIWVAKGVYSDFTSRTIHARVFVSGGFLGNETSLEQRDFNANISTIGSLDEFPSMHINGVVVGFSISFGYVSVRENGRLEHCVFANHQGLKIHVYGAGSVAYCHVDSNSGVWVRTDSEDSIIEECSFTNNYDDEGRWFVENRKGTVRNCVFSGNIVKYACIENMGTITNCSIFENHSLGGASNNYYKPSGGIYNTGTVINCMIFGNSLTSLSSSYAAGLYNDYEGKVYNCSIVGNKSGDSPGVYNYYDGTIQNCIIWNNYCDDRKYDLKNRGNVTYSCSSSLDSGTGNISSNPMFINQKEKHSLWNMHLKIESPCVDAGGYVSVVKNDLEGTSRPQNGRYDMGAYEYNPNVLRAFFDVSEDVLFLGDSLTFYDCSYGNPTAWAWDFDSDGNIDSNEENPSYVYSQPGAYTVTLTVSNSDSEDSIVMSEFVHVGKMSYVKKDGDDSNSGDSWSFAFQTISRALELSSPGDHIWVARGTYAEGKELLVPADRFLFGGFSGDETSLELRNSSINSTVIDGQKKYPCVKNAGYMNGFDITNGKGYEENSYGGVFNDFGEMEYCSIYNSTTGVYNLGGTISDCTVCMIERTGIMNISGRINRCRVFNNFSGISNKFSGVITNCEVYNNCSSDRTSGGIYNNSGTIAYCTVYGNTGKETGGIYNYGSAGSVENSIAWGNTALDDDREQYKDISGGIVSYSCYSGAEQGVNGNIDADPLFAHASENPASWNVSLSADSPCIDAGTPLDYVQDDIDGNMRPTGTQVDMGAHECDPQALTALFYTESQFSYGGAIIDFTDCSYGAVSSWSWDFNGDGIEDSSEQNPSYLYTAPGWHTVSLTISDGSSESVYRKKKAIYVGSIFYVTSEGAEDASGESWQESILSISVAMSKASSWDAIWVAAGQYCEDETITISQNVSLYGGFSGTEESLAQRDIYKYKAVIDGLNRSDFQCCVNYGLLDGFYVTGGNAFRGSGISNYGEVRNCFVYGHRATDNGYGAGIYNYGLGRVVNCSASNCFADYGGGIYNLGLVRQCRVFSNYASSGGGVFNAQHGIIEQSSLYGNTSLQNGGGVKNSMDARIENSLVYCNFASGSGGGAYNDGMILNCTVYGNRARYDGAGINNCESVKNSIVWDNYVRENRSDIWAFSSNTEILYSCFDETGLGFQCTQEGNIHEDPLFNHINNNSMSYEFHLRADSPCLNSASAENAPDVDKDGGKRPQNGAIDMGAFECRPDQIQALFSSDQEFASAGSIIHFSDLSYGAFVSWSWDFDSDGIVDSTEQNPEYEYLESGDYQVSLSVSDGDFSSVATGSIHIGQEIFVKKDGDDSLDGGSWANAFATISMALWNCYPGDVICIASGTYNENSTLKIPLSVAVWAGFSEDGSTLAQRNPSIYSTIIDSGDTRAVLMNNGRIDGIDMTGGVGGTYVSPVTNGLYGSIINCEIFENKSYGMCGGVDNYGIMRSCSIYDNIGCSSYSYEYNTDVVVGGVFNCGTIESCRVYKNHSVGYGGIYNFGKCSNCLVYLNKAYSGGGGIYNVKGSVLHCSVYGNTAYSADAGVYNKEGSVYNSIIWGNIRLFYSSDLKVVSDVYNSGGVFEYSCFSNDISGIGNIHQDPCFVNAVDDSMLCNFTICSNSPCIDSGSSEYGIEMDFIQNLRPKGSGFDMGAYEWQYELIDVALQSDVTEGTAPLSVQFSCSVSEHPVSWEWDFDADGTIDSTDANPLYTYQEPGLYSVSLTLSFPNDIVTKYEAGYISVVPDDAPELSAEFMDSSLNSVICTGTDYQYILRFRNNGKATWFANGEIKLGALGNEDPLSSSLRYYLNEDVRFGEIAEFVITIHSDSPGIYLSDWQMLKEGVAWFGDEFSQEVQVEMETAVQFEQWSLFH